MGKIISYILFIKKVVFPIHWTLVTHSSKTMDNFDLLFNENFRFISYRLLEICNEDCLGNETHRQLERSGVSIKRSSVCVCVCGYNRISMETSPVTMGIEVKTNRFFDERSPKKLGSQSSFSLSVFFGFTLSNYPTCASLI